MYYICVYGVGLVMPWCKRDISHDVGRLEVAYPSLGAMRRPDCWDKHGKKLYSHVFFVSIILAVYKMANE